MADLIKLFDKLLTDEEKIKIKENTKKLKEDMERWNEIYEKTGSYKEANRIVKTIKRHPYINLAQGINEMNKGHIIESMATEKRYRLVPTGIKEQDLFNYGTDNWIVATFEEIETEANFIIIEEE